MQRARSRCRDSAFHGCPMCRIWQATTPRWVPQLIRGVRQPNVRVAAARHAPRTWNAAWPTLVYAVSVCTEHLSLAAAEETAAAEQQCEQPSTIITTTPINQRLQLREAAGASAPCGGANCNSMAVCSRARLHTQMHITKSGRCLLVGPLVSPPGAYPSTKTVQILHASPGTAIDI